MNIPEYEIYHEHKNHADSLHIIHISAQFPWILMK